MRAPHIVGEDLELRGGVDLGMLGQEQRLVRLFGVGLLGVELHDDLAVEHRVGFTVQDAFVELVARAVGLGVIDHRVVVDETTTVRHVESVERAVDPFTIQQRIDVVANERASQRDGMGREAAAPAQRDMHAGNMKRLQALSQQLVVIDHRIGPGHDLGHGIGEVRRVPQARVTFHDPSLTVLSCEDEHARVVDRGLLVRGRHKQQVNRLLNDRIGRNLEERPVAQKRRVERRERLILIRRQPGQVPLDKCRIAVNRLAEAPGFDAGRQGTTRRELRREAPIDHDELGKREVFEGEAVELIAGQGRETVVGEREGRCRDRRDVGEPPRFELRRRKPELAEAVDRRLAQLADRGRHTPVWLARHAIELGEVAIAAFRSLGHRRPPHAPTWAPSASSHPYPFSSSSSASSLPPDLTMRPAESTWT